eukprot:4845928-Heterocapsa_arctica.AAC.1
MLEEDGNELAPCWQVGEQPRLRPPGARREVCRQSSTCSIVDDRVTSSSSESAMENLIHLADALLLSTEVVKLSAR